MEESPSEASQSSNENVPGVPSVRVLTKRVIISSEDQEEDEDEVDELEDEDMDEPSDDMDVDKDEMEF